MILADTSLWIQHFRVGVPEFAAALTEGMIMTHPVVIGELATGNLVQRVRTLVLLRSLSRTMVGTAEECLDFIESQLLYGRGIGWNDVQLLVGARLSGVLLWSLDTRLATTAKNMGVAFGP